MRKTLIAAISLALLALGLVAAPPALAAANSYTVQGHPITAAPGLALLGDSCTTSGATPPTVNPLVRDGGTLGTSALGWTVNQGGFEAGPVTTLAGNPDYLNSFHLDALAPTGTTGHAYARINWDADTWYIGWSSVTVQAGEWRHLDLTNRAYTWTLYDAGTSSEFEERLTVQELVTGPGFQAISLGVLLGCAGEQFFVDRLMVGNAENSSTYDFEKVPPVTPVCHPGHVTPECPAPEQPVDHKHHKAHLEWSTNGRDVSTGTAVTIKYGQSLWMLGHAHLHSDLNGNSWYSGVGTLTSHQSAGSSVKTESGAFSASQYAAVKESPERTTIYSFTAAAQDGYPAVKSEEVTVYVQAKVRAKVLDRHLVEGQKLAVKGRITPGTKRVKVTLQRKTGNRWRSLSSSRTRSGGKFQLGVPASTPGTWKLRVKVNTTSSNVGTVTKAAKVKVNRYVPPKPKPQQPPPTPQADTTPEVTVAVSTPAPPPAPAAAPTPPPRPTSSGRVAIGAWAATEPVRTLGTAPGAAKP